MSRRLGLISHQPSSKQSIPIPWGKMNGMPIQTCSFNMFSSMRMGLGWLPIFIYMSPGSPLTSPQSILWKGIDTWFLSWRSSHIANLIVISRCIGTEVQICQHFNKLWCHIVIPQLHMVSAMGMTFDTYKLDKPSKCMNPSQNAKHWQRDDPRIWCPSPGGAWDLEPTGEQFSSRLSGCQSNVSHISVSSPGVTSECTALLGWRSILVVSDSGFSSSLRHPTSCGPSISIINVREFRT